MVAGLGILLQDQLIKKSVSSGIIEFTADKLCLITMKFCFGFSRIILFELHVCTLTAYFILLKSALPQNYMLI